MKNDINDRKRKRGKDSTRLCSQSGWNKRQGRRVVTRHSDIHFFFARRLIGLNQSHPTELNYARAVGNSLASPTSIFIRRRSSGVRRKCNFPFFAETRSKNNKIKLADARVKSNGGSITRVFRIYCRPTRCDRSRNRVVQKRNGLDSSCSPRNVAFTW